MYSQPELTNVWGLWQQVLKILIWAQKGSVANIIANSNKCSSIYHIIYQENTYKIVTQFYYITRGWTS